MPKSPNRIRKTHSITMDPDTWRALEKLSRDEDRSISVTIGRICRKELEAKGYLPLPKG